jgi:hypothetical protein
MWWFADGGGVEQPDGSFLHLRTHTPDPFPSVSEFLRTSPTYSKAAKRCVSGVFGEGNSCSVPIMLTMDQA